MRRWMLAAALCLAGHASPSLAQDATTTARWGAKANPSALQRQAGPDVANQEARRREEERHKRWNDRMRRATRSLCQGC